MKVIIAVVEAVTVEFQMYPRILYFEIHAWINGVCVCNLANLIKNLHENSGQVGSEVDSGFGRHSQRPEERNQT